VRSLVGVTLLVGVPLLGLLPLCFLSPKACAHLCNVFVQSRQFHAKFVCLFFHVKFSTILASIQCGSPYLAYWNWPFSAGSMPRFPSSARAENGCNRRVWLIGEGSYRSGTHNSKPPIYRGPRRQPAGRRIPRPATGDIGSNRRGRLGPTDPEWPLPWAAGLLAWTRALFRRGDAHARCATHVWSWLHPS
jgi:hypothetical protein